MRSTLIVLIGLVTSTLFNAVFADQTPQPVNLDAFEGYEHWPIMPPGERRASNAKLTDQRIVFAARFPGAQGLSGPLENTTMLFDVSEVFFKGRPALWLQWTSTSRKNGVPGTASTDYLIVDRETHRTLHRIQSMGSALGPPAWAGPFAITNYPQDTIVKTIIKEDGSADMTTLEADANGTIDFAALPFWLPFLQLETGMKFRVPYYRAPLNEVDGLPIYVAGRKDIVDVHGTTHNVWNVQVMSIGGGGLTEFWISEKAPYFLGWDFRLANGKPLSTMAYDKHWILGR